MLLLVSQPNPIVQTYSIRPRVQSQAQPIATYYLPSLVHTFSVSLLFAHQLFFFAIYVSFLKPLMPRAEVAMMDRSLQCDYSKTTKLQSCTNTRALRHANTQMFVFRQISKLVRKCNLIKSSR